MGSTAHNARSAGPPSPRSATIARWTQDAAGATPEELRVAAGGPLNLEGILTPEARISAQTRRLVAIG